MSKAEEARQALRRGKNRMRATARDGHPESLLSPVKECYVTGARVNLDRHHCFHGVRREVADKWGCWVWLRHDVHMRLHQTDPELDKRLKRECQEAFEAEYGHEKFMEIFGKSYL